MRATSDSEVVVTIHLAFHGQDRGPIVPIFADLGCGSVRPLGIHGWGHLGIVLTLTHPSCCRKPFISGHYCWHLLLSSFRQGAPPSSRLKALHCGLFVVVPTDRQVAARHWIPVALNELSSLLALLMCPTVPSRSGTVKISAAMKCPKTQTQRLPWLW